ncbi:unnamed protein product, partial [Ectocarpus sp. 4 AP-2014]
GSGTYRNTPHPCRARHSQLKKCWCRNDSLYRQKREPLVEFYGQVRRRGGSWHIFRSMLQNLKLATFHEASLSTPTPECRRPWAPSPHSQNLPLLDTPRVFHDESAGLYQPFFRNSGVNPSQSSEPLDVRALPTFPVDSVEHETDNMTTTHPTRVPYYFCVPRRPSRAQRQGRRSSP